MVEPDLFAAESAVLAAARAAHEDDSAGAADYRRVLGEMMVHYERLMRETRRLIRRSDRAERDMNQLNRQLHELAGQLEYRATHDPLTGALNRAALIERASRLLEQDDVALIVLDIDHFKQVNDDFGHPAGDAVIQAVVRCLSALLGEQVAVGRVGRRRILRGAADAPPGRSGRARRAHLPRHRARSVRCADRSPGDGQRGHQLEPLRHAVRRGLPARRRGAVRRQARRPQLRAPGTAGRPVVPARKI